MAGELVFGWKKAPFTRLLFALCPGILLQRYLNPPLFISFSCLAISCVIWILFYHLSVRARYSHFWITGLAIFPGISGLGMLLTRYHDPRNHEQWLDRYDHEKGIVIAKIMEPVLERPGTYKTTARMNALVFPDKSIPVNGRILVYFRKDSALAGSGLLDGLGGAGRNIIFDTPPREIKNAGNPGGFDYRSRMLYEGITHQVFLKQGEYVLSAESRLPGWRRLLIQSRKRILTVLRNNIPGERERGLAEALLIGYREDLDRDLMQTYARTGVVHIIAISGLHLGMIYGILTLLFQPLLRNRRTRYLYAGLIIGGLWIFSLLTGAHPSVLRSALMFTLIIASQVFSRRSGIYHSLSLSAFFLLCVNPWWLWDTGFQLSYSAVLSIVIFNRPVYQFFYFRNRWIDRAWKTCAVTLAAQVLTVPLCAWYFHQLPVYFLLANFFAVPLAGIILFSEILLCSLHFIPALAALTGRAVSGIIRLMNHGVSAVESLPGSTWEDLQVNFIQVLLLYLFIAGFFHWLWNRSIRGLIAGLFFLGACMIIRANSFIHHERQWLVVIYQVRGKKAIEYIRGRKYVFDGDPGLEPGSTAWYFNLRPARILHRVSPGQPRDLIRTGNQILFGDKKILLVDRPFHIQSTGDALTLDLLVCSGRKTRFPILDPGVRIMQLVIDGSVPSRVSAGIKKECLERKIPCHDVQESGAFVKNLR